MARRLCEVRFEGPGQPYRLTLEADSVFHAAVLFYSHCCAPPPGATPPRIPLEAVLIIVPAFQVHLKDALRWANEQAERQHNKAQHLRSSKP